MNAVRKLCSLILIPALIFSVFSLVPMMSASGDASADNADISQISLPELTGSNGFVRYTMDDPAGTTVMLNASDGVPRDTIALKGTFVPDGGILGGALSFNGTSDYVQVNNNEIGPTGFLHGQYSVETVTFWIKPASLNGKQMLYKQGGNLGGMAVRINNGYLEASIATNAVNLFDKIALGSSDIGRWIHITVCFNQGKGYLYLNGKCVSSITTTETSIPAAKKGTSIGRNMFEPNAFGETAAEDQWYQGMIDDFRVYSVAVTPKVNIKSIADCGYAVVDLGSSESAIAFPERVTVNFSSKYSEELTVRSWNPIKTFDSSLSGVYEYAADIAYSEHISNDNYIVPRFM